MNIDQTLLLHDLTDGITGFQALDQAVSVLIEWGILDAELAAEYVREVEKNN